MRESSSQYSKLKSILYASCTKIELERIERLKLKQLSINLLYYYWSYTYRKILCSCSKDVYQPRSLLLLGYKNIKTSVEVFNGGYARVYYHSSTCRGLIFLTRQKINTLGLYTQLHPLPSEPPFY